MTDQNELPSGLRAGPGGEAPDGKEPAFNAPWPSLALVALILGSYAWQSSIAGREAAALVLGFAPTDLERGRWLGLVSLTLVHGGWTHALMNALGALAFGPPVARLMGRGPAGALSFLAFYLACGALSTLGYAALHLGSEELVIGASGAVSGLMGAAARTFGRRSGLNPVFSRPVASLAIGWTVANLIMAIFGAGPLMPGARIAWEAHIAGFFAGLLLIGPWLGLLRPGASR